MKNFLSGVYLLAALGLLAATCLYCYPGLGGTLYQAVAGLEDSPVRQAFSTVAEGLEAGDPVRDAVGSGVQVLFEQ